jgi:hypothetical protein
VFQNENFPIEHIKQVKNLQIWEYSDSHICMGIRIFQSGVLVGNWHLATIHCENVSLQSQCTY